MVRASGVSAILVLPRVGFSDAQMHSLAGVPAGGQMGSRGVSQRRRLHKLPASSLWIIPLILPVFFDNGKVFALDALNMSLMTMRSGTCLPG